MLLHPNLRLSRVLRITWRVDLILIISGTLAYWLEKYILLDYVNLPTVVPSLLGTAIAFFIGFNNNQSYSRWWEARTIWGGIVNDSRSWARAVLHYHTEAGAVLKDDNLPRRMVRRHIAFLYALKKALRNADDQTYTNYLSPQEAQAVAGYANVPSALLDRQARDLQRLVDEGRIDGFQFMALNEMIVRFSDGMGKSERIKGTVFPPTYLYFTRLFIWLFVTLLTMTIVNDTGVWSIPLGWLIGFVFHVTHINGLSLMNPFEYNPAGVPLDAITRTIEINLLEALAEKEVPKPVQSINDEYIM